jgi:tetratricopeptide (TPR) repeat protein
MKNSILALLGFLLVTSVATAQDDGPKLAKQAGRAWATYNMDKASNISKLVEAKQKIDQAIQTPEAQAIADTWITRGNIYRTIVSTDSTIFKLFLKDKPGIKGENDAMVAFQAYKKAYDITTKKYEKEDAVKGIYEVQAYLINIGVEKFQKGAYEKSYASFQAATQSHDVLKSFDKKQKSLLDSVPSYKDILYFTATAAVKGKMNKEALEYYNKVVQYQHEHDKVIMRGKEKVTVKDTVSADIYSGLYNAKLAMNDEAGAAATLLEGRKLWPNDTELLFLEINAYLKAGKLSELTDRLKQAIKQEPKNVGLYVTLGNVYDNLYQAKIKEKKDDEATQHFNDAKSYYEQAIAIDPKAGDAIYSIGALYYNKAAFRTQEMNALPEDYTKPGLEKLETYRKEIMGLFDQALPYFQQSEGINPNDQNTLIALSEIYARKEDELSLEFKKRLDKVKAGGKNDAPYFKK